MSVRWILSYITLTLVSGKFDLDKSCCRRCSADSGTSLPLSHSSLFFVPFYSQIYLVLWSLRLLGILWRILAPVANTHHGLCCFFYKIFLVTLIWEQCINIFIFTNLRMHNFQVFSPFQFKQVLFYLTRPSSTNGLCNPHWRTSAKGKYPMISQKIY